MLKMPSTLTMNVQLSDDMNVYWPVYVLLCVFLSSVSYGVIITYHESEGGNSYAPESGSEWEMIDKLDRPKRVTIFHNHCEYLAFIPWDHKTGCPFELTSVFDTDQQTKQASGGNTMMPLLHTMTFVGTAKVLPLSHHSRKPKTACKYFLRGYCRFREKCRFLHLEKYGSEPEICLNYLNTDCKDPRCKLKHIEDEAQIPESLPKCVDCQEYGHKRTECPWVEINAT